MSTIIREMMVGELREVKDLWDASHGVGLSAADSETAIARFLQRNPGLSFVALNRDNIVGAVLCGHDGRRGYLHHLAVVTTHRRRGIGRRLVTRTLESLRAVGIDKCHLFVFTENESAINFWDKIGWTHREELAMMSAWTN
jgi:ribosomal protein S18 acetylase RimI-like enzyme